MAQVFRTTQDEKHWHVVYVDQANGAVLTTVDNGHDHKVLLTADPQTHEPQIIIGENEGHKHYLKAMEAVLPVSPKGKTETQVIDYDLSLFKSAATLEEESRTRGIEAARFFKGDQWEESVRQSLRSNKRACQTHNITAAQIDILSGIARQNRLDPRAFPVEGSDEGVADIITALLMRLMKMNRMPTQEIRVFEDGLVPGRGLFNVGVTQKRNPLGDIFVERFPWKDGYFGKHEELDASDATHCHKAKWISSGEAISRYPSKKDEILGMIEVSGQVPDEPRQTVNDNWNTHETLLHHSHDPQIVDREHKRLRIIEHEIKEFRTAHIAVNQDLSLNQEVSQVVADKLKTLPNINVLDLSRERIRISVTIGTALVKNYYADRPYEGFSLTPYYVYKYDDSEGFNGKVEAMKDSQREVNKRASQMIDAANRTLAPGWNYDNDTFESEKDKNDWLKTAGVPGAAHKVADASTGPQAKELPRFPAELFALQKGNLDMMQTVSNITPSLSGQSSPYQSGAAAMGQRQAGLVGNERVFDNFILTKQVVAQKMFKLAQKYLSPERIARIVLSEASDPNRLSDLQIAGQPIPQQRSAEEDQQKMQDILRILKTKDMAEYDISIGEQPLSPTMKEFERKAWAEAQQMGVPVPPELMVELSSLPNKAKWSRIMQQLQQQQMEMEKLKFNTEMQKAGRLPPSQNQ